MMKRPSPRWKAYAALVTVLILSSCASLKKNTWIGAGIGYGTGAIAGAIVGSPEHAVRGAVIGAAAGAAVGGIIGYLTEPKPEAVFDAKSIRMEVNDPNLPPLSQPEVRKVWIPDKIEDGKYEMGHYEYIIERGTVWNMR